MKLTVSHQQKLLEWAALRLNSDGWPDGSLALGVIERRDEQKPILRAVLVFNAFYGSRCSVHIASDGARRWATADIMTRISAFIHIAKGVNRIGAVIAATNTQAQIAALKLGFQIEERHRPIRHCRPAGDRAKDAASPRPRLAVQGHR